MHFYEYERKCCVRWFPCAPLSRELWRQEKTRRQVAADYSLAEHRADHEPLALLHLRCVFSVMAFVCSAFTPRAYRSKVNE